MTILISKITRRQVLTAGAALATCPAQIGFAAADETVGRVAWGREPVRN